MRATGRGQRGGRSAMGTIASDDLVDVATADLDQAEQGIARGAMRELDAMQEKRQSGEKRHSADRQSSDASKAPSGRSANIPSIRNGVARILNAAAEAVEEYLDVEEDEDKVPSIPEEDHFEGMRSKVESFIAEIERKPSPSLRAASSDNVDLTSSQRGASLNSRGQSIRSRGRSIPGIAESSTEQHNEPVGRNRSIPDSPFLRSRLQAQAMAKEPRQLIDQDKVAFDKRDATSFEIMGRDKVRDSILTGPNARYAFGLPPRQRYGNAPPQVTPLRPQPRLSDEVPSRTFTRVGSNDPTHRLSLASAPSQGLGTIEEIRYGDAGQLVRRRIALPWQLTLLFGCVTVVGCLCGMTTLGIAIRNVIYLNGPKAGPQIPDVIKGIDQILALLEDPQLNLLNEG